MRPLFLLPHLLALALATGCQLPQSHNMSGVQLFQQGNYAGAVNEFQKALALDSKNADAYYNLAATHHRYGSAQKDQNLLAQAESFYSQCLQYDPNHIECRRGFAVLMSETGRQDQAFAMLRKWAESNPQLAEARVELARLYQESGDLKNAQRHLHDALALDARNSRAWAALGKLREDNGEFVQALNNYQQSYASNQYQPGIAARIARLNQSLGSPGVNPSGTRMVQVPVPSKY